MEFPVIQGLQKAAEHIADFMLDKPEEAIRQYRPSARRKTEKAGPGTCSEGPGPVDRRAARGLQAEQAGQEKRRRTTSSSARGSSTRSTRHADIRFEIVKGVKETANFLLDFILGAPPNTQRQWHVFFRCRDGRPGDKIPRTIARVVRYPRKPSGRKSPRSTTPDHEALLRALSRGCGVHSHRPGSCGRRISLMPRPAAR